MYGGRAPSVTKSFIVSPAPSAPARYHMAVPATEYMIIVPIEVSANELKLTGIPHFGRPIPQSNVSGWLCSDAIISPP